MNTIRLKSKLISDLKWKVWTLIFTGDNFVHYSNLLVSFLESVYAIKNSVKNTQLWLMVCNPLTFKQARITNKRAKQLHYFVWHRETATSSWFCSSGRMLKNWRKKNKMPIGRTQKTREGREQEKKGIWSLINEKYKRSTSDWKLHLNKIQARNEVSFVFR